MKQETEDALQIFLSAVAAVHPAQLIPQHLRVSESALHICGLEIPKHSFQHIYIIGAGKASAAMAVAAENILGNLITDGLVTTKYGHGLPLKKLRIQEAAHPVPDEQCVQAVVATIQLLRKATVHDLVICLISGGASALWCDVPAGISLQEAQATFSLLLQSGAGIGEINIVRKHLSAIKGGQLVRHCNGARVFSLIISDVPGDNLEVIASGPTVADGSTFSEAFDILSKYKLLDKLPAGILQHLKNGLQGKQEETPKPGDELFHNTINTIIGTNRIALMAAEEKARQLGYHTLVIAEQATADAAIIAKGLVALALANSDHPKLCVLQGGETTVQVTGQGKGGRNQHIALAALCELNLQQSKKPVQGITIFSGGTDGTDGPTDAAGAVANIAVLDAAVRKNLSPQQYLEQHDAYNFFLQAGGLIITGPTQTNVMDIMMALVHNQ